MGAGLEVVFDDAEWYLSAGPAPHLVPVEGVEGALDHHTASRLDRTPQNGQQLGDGYEGDGFASDCVCVFGDGRVGEEGGLLGGARVETTLDTRTTKLSHVDVVVMVIIGLYERLHHFHRRQQTPTCYVSSDALERLGQVDGRRGRTVLNGLMHCVLVPVVQIDTLPSLRARSRTGSRVDFECAVEGDGRLVEVPHTRHQLYHITVLVVVSGDEFVVGDELLPCHRLVDVASGRTGATSVVEHALQRLHEVLEGPLLHTLLAIRCHLWVSGGIVQSYDVVHRHNLLALNHLSEATEGLAHHIPHGLAQSSLELGDEQVVCEGAAVMRGAETSEQQFGVI
mmetsp:Transcript_15108/g.35947  ORF Transcript_15108/g.35947 Transcript_15108/m.35947 type:complete len:339 (+) Transcript_15108:991-2007(+)